MSLVHRSLVRRCAGAIMCAGLIATPVAAQAAPAAHASTNAVDIAFMEGNGQTNLAEITIGKIALMRSHNASVRALARRTISDHYAAEARLRTLAHNLGIKIPGRPDAAQRRAAAQLKTVPASKFDVTYLRVQVAGHKLSIAATDRDLNNGASARVHRYAAYYLPVATMHLRMSERDLAKLHPHHA